MITYKTIFGLMVVNMNTDISVPKVIFFNVFELTKNDVFPFL